MRTYNRAVDHQCFRIRIKGQYPKNVVQYAVFCPFSKATVYTFPWTIALWQIPPCRSTSRKPHHRVEHGSVVLRRASLFPGSLYREKASDLFPFCIRDFVSSRTHGCSLSYLLGDFMFFKHALILIPNKNAHFLRIFFRPAASFSAQRGAATPRSDSLPDEKISRSYLRVYVLH